MHTDCLPSPDRLELVRGISMPALVIHGKYDPCLPSVKLLEIQSSVREVGSISRSLSNEFVKR